MSSGLRVLIADDEAPARGIIVELLAGEPTCHIVGEAAHGLDAVKKINELTPDIVFLDIQMPKLDGLEVLELIDVQPVVIFTTAYDAYAIQAFEINAVDYLLKPFSAQRFAAAWARAKARVGAVPAISASVLAAASRPPNQPLERLVVRDGGRAQIVAVNELDYAQAQGDYVELHAGTHCWLKQQTLQSLEATLDPQRFVRIHRSYLVNVERLVRLDSLGKDSRVAVLAGGQRLPVSRAGYARVAQLLGE